MRRFAAVALACFATLSAFADPELPVEEHIAQLRSKYLREREAAAEALIKVGPSITKRVSELLTDADARVQRAAVEILSRLGTAESIQPLLPLISHADPTIRGQVRDAFMRLGRTVRPALEAARDADATVAPDIQELLSEMTQTEIEAAFELEVMSDGSSGFYPGQFAKLRSLGPDIGPMLAKMSADGFDFQRDNTPMGRFRIMAIDAMADVGYTEGVPDLLRLADGSGDLARAATGSLWRLGQKEPAAKMEVQLKAGLDPGGMGQTYLAELYSRTDQFEKAIEMYNAAIGSNGGRMQGTTYYNLACAYSRMGKKKEACHSLKRAVGASFRNVQWMKKDGDLDAIRGEPEYIAIERELSGEERLDPEAPLPQPPQPEEPGGQTE
ncbi:MAG: HEAT repeat domain-containing protein [Planctomycetota bacterium]